MLYFVILYFIFCYKNEILIVCIDYIAVKISIVNLKSQNKRI